MRTKMCAGITAVLASTGVLASAAAEDHRRELDAHEHGHGSLTIAIEQGRVQMELEVPGADIVGFEYVPKTDEDIAAVEKGKAMLAQPLTLFVVPDAAGCAVEMAEVALIADDHDDHGDHDDHDDHDDHAEEHHDDEHHDEDHHDDEHHGDEHAEDDHHDDEHGEHHDEHGDEARHAEFHAEYELVCASPDELSSIDFAYFDAFAGAEELEVGVITEATQALYEVERDSPSIDLPAVR